MKREIIYVKNGILTILLMVVMLSKINAQALTGSLTIPSTNFPSIKAAVDSLNIQGVGTGGVTFDIAAGYTELLSSSIVVSATGTASNPITFQKSGVGANPLITSFVGTQLASSTTSIDIMWSFIGSDFVIIDGIDLIESSSNTTATTLMEVGIGFYKANATNGANNNTVKNCTITLNRLNATAATGPRWAGSVGIELAACLPTAVGTTIVQTSIAGASSNNKFYSNTIQNCNGGIALGGAAIASPYTLADLNNDVGGNSLATGNTIINFGGGAGATSACMAIWASNQWSFNISYNKVNNNDGSGVSHPATNRGIFAAANSAGASCNITNNIVTISAGASTTAISWCIDVELASTGANGNVVNINNNQLLNCNQTAASTAAFTAIWLNTAATTVNCNNNYIYGFTYNGTGTSQCILSQLANGTLSINNNIIDSTTLSGSSATGTHHNIGVTAAPTVALNINNNNVTRTNLTTAGTGTKTLYPIYCSAATPIINLNDNIVDNLTRNGTSGGTTIGIYHTGGTSGTTTVNIRRNTISNMSISGAGTASVLYGIQVSTGTIVVDSNTIFGLNCLKPTGTGAIYGIYDISAPTVETYSNNKIYDLNHLGTGIVYGIYAFTTTGTRLVSANTIYNLTGNGGNVIGILMSSSSPNIVRNKIYALRSNGTTTGTVFGISITSLGTSGIATVANNLIDSLLAPNYSGTADAIRGISSAITTTSTNLRVYYNTIRLSATTGGANFSSATLFFTGSTSSSTARLDLRNNILINLSVANGTGTASVIRNSTTAISNYGNTSNNNLFYAGVPSANRLIYADGVNADQTIAAFKARLVNMEQFSFTENSDFISLVGASNDFLHLNLLTPTLCESGGIDVSAISTDFDNVIRQGNQGYTGTGSFPDVGADEGEFTGIAMVLDSSNVDQITSALLLNSTNQHIVAIRVHVANNWNALNLTSLKLNTAGTSNANDIQNAKVFYTGSNNFFYSMEQFGSTVPNPNGVFYINGSKILTPGVNYFWVTYDIKNTATPNNFVDVRVDSLVIGGVNTAPINGDPNGARMIRGPLNGNYNVGVGQAYTTLTAATNDLNILGVGGPVIFTLKDTLYSTATGEVFPIVFNGHTGSSALNTVTLRPDFGVASRIVSSSFIATIDLNGIANFILDGRQGGTGGFTAGDNLIITNTNTTAPAIRFINEASSNKLLYTDFRSNNVTATGSSGAGVINFGTTTGDNGNDNNIIKFCDIHEEGSGKPIICISSIGSAIPTSANNDANTIDSCNIYNFSSPTIGTAGIYIGANNSTWIINGNKFYQTSAVNTTGTPTHRVIWVTPNTGSLTTVSGFVITNNFIGGSASNGSGIYTMTGTTAYQFYAMDLSVGLGAASSVQNNTFTNFALTSGFSGNGTYGFNVANGNVNVGTITGNLIGSTTTNGAITYTTTTTNGGLIPLRSGAGGTINFSNNIISGIDLISNSTINYNSFNGIAGSGGANITIHNNTVGSTTLLNSINMVSTSATATAASTLRGIICNSVTSGVVNTVTNNIVANLNSNYSATGTQITNMVGISVTTGTSTVTGNVVKNLTSATNTTASGNTSAIVGLAYTSTTAPTVISGNSISNLLLTGTATNAAVHCEGLFYSGPTTGINNISRNNIHSLSLNAVNPSAILTGMDIGAGLVTVSNNMIRLGYDSVGNSINTACAIRGISKNVSNTNIYFNSVYIGGTSVGSNATNTFALQKTGNATDNIRNNIFMNARSNASTGGKHYQVFLLNNTNLTLNNNIYFGGGNGAVFGSLNNGTSDVLNYTSGWVASDLNSGVADPQFVNATGSTLTGDLHISSTIPTPIESSGVLISTITEDFDGQLRSSFSPTDIGADAGNFIPLDIFPPSIGSVIVFNTASTGDRNFSVNITDVTGVPTTSGNQPRIYFKKSAVGSYNSTGAIRLSGTPQNGQWNFTVSASAMGGLTIGDSVYFFIVAQDSASTNNLSSLPGGADASNVNSVTTPPNALFSYRIVNGLSGNILVGAGQTFTSLTAAGGLFEAINNGSLTASVTAIITSDLLEDGANSLNPINETGAGNYTFTIVPDGTTERLIAGSNAAGLIKLNGARRVKIDGRFAGSGRYLRIRNRTLSGHVITFLNDARRDTITYCHVESINNTVGTITFSTSNVVGGTGNDSNGITYCIIRDTLGSIAGHNVHNTGISSSGTAGLENSENTIASNEIFNFGFNAINLNATGTGDNWVITNNAIYQTLPRANVFTIIPVSGGSNHTISNNSFGGSAADRSGAAFTTTTGTTPGIIGINLALTAASTANVLNNTFSNISGGARAVNLVAISNGIINVTNNIFGGGAQAYDTIQNGYDNGIINVTGGTVNITNNLIGNVSYYGNAGDRTSGITITGGTVHATGNTIRDIRANSTGTAFTFLPTGVQINGGLNHNIESNAIFNIVNTNAGTAAYTVTGIVLTSGTNVTIQRNRIYNIWGSGTGTGTASNQVFGIYNANNLGTNIRNNQIAIGNNTIGETRVFGVQDVATSGVNNYYNNTFFINGTTIGGANNSYCLFRGASANLNSFNNIFYNKRATTGTGTNYATGSNSTAGITPATTNYNLYLVNDTSRLAEAPTGIANSIAVFNTLYTNANTYSSNWYVLNANIAAQNLFTDTLIGNLGIVNSHSASWYSNGKGLALPSVTNDFNNNSRSVSMATGATDLGSVEFSTTTTPIAATASAAPAANTTTNYTFAGRNIARISWGATGTVPSSVSVLFYSGSNAPNLIGGSTRFNSYYNITATGGTGYNYGISLLADSAQFGNVSGINATKIARYSGSSWNLIANSSANGAIGMMQTTANTQTDFGIFTGTDFNSNPLPVTFNAFAAKAYNKDVLIEWSTASEINNKGFEVERSEDGKTFDFIGYKKGAGNSSKEQTYGLTDANALNNSPVLYYRLKQIDFDGNSSYSNIVKVVTNAELSNDIAVYPNPFEHDFQVSFNSATNGLVQIELMDIQGKLVSTKTATFATGLNSISVNENANLLAGIYFARITINGEVKTIKLIKD